MQLHSPIALQLQHLWDDWGGLRARKLRAAHLLFSLSSQAVKEGRQHRKG